MCDPGTLLIAGTALAVAGTVASTYATYSQARYEAKVDEANRKQASAAASDALNRGETDVLNESRKRSQLVGAQRAAMAANGIDVSFGNAADVTADTEMFASQDAQTLRENAAREAHGYDVNAANYGAAAEASRSKATAALISGALSVGSTIAGGASRYGSMQAGRSGASSGAMGM
jgi:hypothetical protein